jgi:hypothetical protein
MYDGTMKRLLVQTQLSNIVNGKFDLACDSGWQMTINRVREMLKLNSELEVTILGPLFSQLVDAPSEVDQQLWDKYDANGECRLVYVEISIIPNALLTRYDFDVHELATALCLDVHKTLHEVRYDAVYLNDPMLLRAYKAMFHVKAGYQPKFYVHSHFVDVPSCPKFPQEASLWLGQCEAAIKADFNFWQCRSAMEQFFSEMRLTYRDDVVDAVLAKSLPSDDGYSIAEITTPVDEAAMCFTAEEWQQKTAGKVVLFFPNRISPSSGDYTSGCRFMFEVLPELRKRRQDFVVVCGNPNLKFSNDELLQRCGKDGYIKLMDGTPTRNEYRFIARNSHIVVALYDAKSDTYGGTASRECVELGCMPLWPRCNEYFQLAQGAWGDEGLQLLTQSDLSDIVDVADRLITRQLDEYKSEYDKLVGMLRSVIRVRCSYEKTVPWMMVKMGLHVD